MRNPVWFKRIFSFRQHILGEHRPWTYYSNYTLVLFKWLRYYVIFLPYFKTHIFHFTDLMMRLPTSPAWRIACSGSWSETRGTIASWSEYLNRPKTSMKYAKSLPDTILLLLHIAWVALFLMLEWFNTLYWILKALIMWEDTKK